MTSTDPGNRSNHRRPLAQRRGTERVSTQSQPTTTMTARLVKRGRAALMGLVATAVVAAGLSAAPRLSTSASAAPLGTDFKVTIADLTFILDQIKIAEHHVGPTFDPLSPCSNIIGPGPNQIPEGANAEQIPFGLRTLNGVCNNLVPGRELFGATYQPFIRLMEPEYRAAEPAPPLGPGVVQPSSYDPTFENLNGYVNDSEPRIISNLIADQTAGNPAANAAAGGPGLTGGPALPTCLSLATVPPTPLTDLPPCEPEAGESYYIENVAPDLGISRPFSTAFTFFGQFFDHGLDLTTKAGEPVFMPLQADDPLILEGAVPPGLEFMVMSRAIQPAGPDAKVPVNQASPYVDQNQTYTSDPSQQVFQREYVNSPPVDTGRLLGGNPAVGAPGTGLTTWADIKDQAATLLGFRLLDTDVLDVPMMAADLYGNFIPGPGGFPQMITKGPDGVAGTVDDVLLEGDPTSPIPTPSDVVRTDHGWLVDIAHHAAPGAGRVPDAGSTVPGSGSVACTPTTPGSQIEGFCDDLDPATYDDELLDAHFICGDGRCNENIALSSVHHVFHSEHNRLLDQIKDTLTVEASQAFLDEWKLTPGGDWNGQRLFQAAKFATEMQYQHLAFEEFARRVQPAVDVFAGYDTSIDAGIMAEFAHAVYRFGHTMLTEEIMRRDAGTSAGERHPVGLIDGFLNPPEFFEGVDGTDFAKTPDEAAGGILRGLASENGQEIDEFVVEALRNNLLGLPLDLVSINLARGRDTGIPRLNSFRQNIFDLTGDALYKPYSSWLDYGFALSHPESLVNYIAAYGTHVSVTTAPTLAARRDAATILMTDPDFMNGTGAWTGENTGVDDLDLWIGSIGEREEFFGGLLGPTANFIFELQMENLQNGDRFYYLHRLSGIPMLTSLEGNSLSELIERNTTAVQLAADVFMTPSFTFDLDIVHPADCSGVVDDPATSYLEPDLLVLMPDCTIRFPVLEPAAFSGRTGAAGTADDMILGGLDDDSIRGNQGNDRIDAGEGNDVILGGDGNDIIFGNQGIDNLKGGNGNDALSGGTGEDLIQGGDGDDFAMINADPGEVFGGTGDDIVIGGTSFDTIFGGGGDDWLVGGGQADLVQGDDGAPFQDNPAGSDGHDVLDGGPGNDDHDAEGGDDIMLAGEGTERFEGMEGFDWVTHKGDPQPADSDLLRRGLLPPAPDTLRDRFDFVEGLSGWMFDDIIRGDDLGLLPVGGPFRADDADALDSFGIDRIFGLAALLPADATSFSAGNILFGGAGSDVLEGRGQNDIIDGDAWLNVQLQAPNLAGGGTLLVDSPSELVAMVFSGAINPGDVNIVRSIEPGTPGTDLDIAEYDGPMADYNITPIDTTSGQTQYEVAHVRGLGGGGGGGNCSDVTSLCNDGTDTLFNIEFLRFSDVDFNISGGAFPDVAVPPRPPAIAPSAPLAVEATVADSASIVSWVEPGSDGGDPNITFNVIGSPAGSCTAVAPDTECEVTGLTNGVSYTFTVTATNSAGTSPASDPSAPVIPAAPPGPPTSVVAVASDTLATLTWLAPADDGSTPILTYTVTGSPAGSCTVVASSLGCVVTGLTNGILHSFTVTATNSAGTGPASAPSNTVTPTAPPVIPPPDPELQALVDCNSPLTHPFEDVSVDSFANDDIACIFNLGITTGTSTTTFEPRRDLNREQMASFLARFYRVVTGLPCDSTPSPFTDVAADSFAIHDISCLFNLGVTEGTSATTFEPDRDVPREEMAAFIARMYIVITGTACSGGTTPFTDIAASPFEDEIGCIFNLGLSTGTAPDSFEPRRDVTREQTASFIARLYRLLTA